MAEFRDRHDQPSETPSPEQARRTDRYAEERRQIRALMDQATKDPAFAPPAEAPRTPRDSLREMPGMSAEVAERYLSAADLAERPWLRPALGASPDARRVIATVDQGEGHHLQRHEGAASGDVARERVELLRDPANADGASRGRSDDAFNVDADGAPLRHVCGAEATAISDPDAFATAVARAMGRSDVRAALNQTIRGGDAPPDIEIPISELLGPNGHEYCEGYRLMPVDGSIHKAMENRAAWVKAQRHGDEPGAARPLSNRISTFEGGVIAIVVRPRADGTGHAITTLYPRPPQD